MYTFRIDTFLAALSVAIKHASHDLTRPHIAGVLITRSPRDAFVDVVATDGCRLSCVSLPESGKSSAKLFVPLADAKALEGTLKIQLKRAAGYLGQTDTVMLTLAHPQLAKLTGDVQNEERLIAKIGDVVIYEGMLSSQEFPPYTQVIPRYDGKDPGTCAWAELPSVQAVYLMDALKACADFYKRTGKKSSPHVRLFTAGRMNPIVVRGPATDEGELLVVMMPFQDEATIAPPSIGKANIVRTRGRRAA